jgi:hypothetical protein
MPSGETILSNKTRSRPLQNARSVAPAQAGATDIRIFKSIRPSEKKNFQTAYILNQYLLIKNAAIFADADPSNNIKTFTALWPRGANGAAAARCSRWAAWCL